MSKSPMILATSLALALLAPAASTVAQDAPAAFSGWIEPGPRVAGGYSPTIDADEPRLGETAYWSANEQVVDGIGIRTTTWRFEDAVGAWEGAYSKFILDVEGVDPNQATVTTALVGDGAYAGLIALTEFDSNQGFGWAIRGIILDADELPAEPEAARPF